MALHSYMGVWKKYIRPSQWDKLILQSEEQNLTQGSYINAPALGFPMIRIFVNKDR